MYIWILTIKTKSLQSDLKPENVDLGAMYAKSLEGDEL